MDVFSLRQLKFGFLPSHRVLVQRSEGQSTSDVPARRDSAIQSAMGLYRPYGRVSNRFPGATRREQSLASMLRQRMFGILAGYEDCNDHDILRPGEPGRISVAKDVLNHRGNGGCAATVFSAENLGREFSFNRDQETIPLSECRVGLYRRTTCRQTHLNAQNNRRLSLDILLSRTPEEAFRGNILPKPIPIRVRDGPNIQIDINRGKCRGDPHLPTINIRVRRAA